LDSDFETLLLSELLSEVDFAAGAGATACLRALMP